MNNLEDLARRLEDGANDYGNGVVEEAAATLRDIACLRKDAARYRFERENRFQWYEPTRHWRLMSATFETVCEGLADTYDDAVDAAMKGALK